MKSKRLVSVLLTALIVASFTPIRAQADVKGKGGLIEVESKNVNPSLKEMNPLVGSSYWVVKIGGNVYLTSKTVLGTNSPILEDEVGADTSEDLDLDKLSVEDCIKIAKVFNEAESSGKKLQGGWSAHDEIVDYFGIGGSDVGKDVHDAIVARDCFLALARSKAKDDVTQIAKIQSELKQFVKSKKNSDGTTSYETADSFAEFSRVASSNLGCKTLGDFYTWCEKQVKGEEVKDAASVNKDTIAKLSNVDFDKCDDMYQHLIAARILSANSEQATDDEQKFLKKAKDKYGKVVPVTIINNSSSDDNIDLLNKVLTDALHKEDNTKLIFKACMSTVLERGSKFSYGSNVKVDLENADVKGALQGGEGNATADKSAEDALKSIKSTLDNNKSVTDNNTKLYLTMAARTRYAIYYMQATDGINKIKENYKDVDDLCRVADDTTTTIGSEPYMFTEPAQLSHFDGYVYLNNIANDIDKLATVLLPLTYKIKTKDDAANMQLQLAELRVAQETNNIMTNPQQLAWKNKQSVKGKYSLDNPDALNPIVASWNREITIEGTDTKTSLAKEYERLSNLGVTFPDMDKLQASSEHPLNKDYFDLEKKQLAAPIRIGTALSATFIPFKTNVYNPVSYRQVKDDDEFFKFHAVYGNYRKALYIDTDIASVSKLRTTGKVGSLKVATLKDVLQCEKDITLYTDDNFYNISKLKEYKNESLNYLIAKSNEDSKEKTWSEKIKDAFSVDLDSILKNKEKSEYSDRMANVDSYAETKQPSFSPKADSADSILMSGDDIDSFLDIDKQKDASYSVMRGYAIVSSIYRDKAVFDYLKSQSASPVFMSSKNMASTNGATQTWMDTYFNYTLLKNIQDSMNVNYKSNLDIGKPVYLDVYGNILTESGDVVIPAAANATLNTSYCPYTAAFLTSYGTKFYIPSDLDFVETSGASQVMEKSEERSRWELANKSLNSTVDMNFLSTASDSAMDTLFDEYGMYIKQGITDFDKFVPNIVLEVLRGAPLDSLDKSAEGLLVDAGVSKFGIARAVQLDELKSSLSKVGQNAILALPNIAFMEGTEYLICLLYKITVVLIALLIIIHIFGAAMDQGFNTLAFLRLFLTTALTLGAIYLIPTLFDLSYYQVNKLCLQKEALQASMLNLEKKDAGVEVGMQDTGEPHITSTLYLKLKKVDMPWYDYFRDLMTSNISATLTDIEKKYAETDLAFGQEDFEFKNGYLYINADKLYDEATVTFNANYKNIYAVSKGNTPASFYTPYFAFLNALCVDVNTFNKENNVYSYTTQVYGGGRVKSLGLIRPYLSSDEFIGNNENGEELTSDVMHIREIYKTQATKDAFTIFSDAEIDTMHKSNWYNGNLTEEQVSDRIEKLNHHIKLFIAKHRDLLGRISDETFLKVLALDASCYYNRLFNTGAADTLEIYNLSEDDLTRLAIAPNSDVITKSPLSYTRFIYEEAGTPGVYAAALLEIVNFISGWLKPITTLFIFTVVFLSLFIYKIILRKQTSSNKGYIYLTILLCSTNVLYALLLKVSMWLPEIGTMATVCIILQTILQIVICALYVYITGIVIMNWKDLGAADFSAKAYDLKIRFENGRFGNLFNSDTLSNNEHIKWLQDKIKNRRRRTYTTIGSEYGDSYGYDDSFDYDYDNYNRNSYNRYADEDRDTEYTKRQRAREMYEQEVERQRRERARATQREEDDYLNGNHRRYRKH